LEDVDGLRRRLAIDQLRVALSRPTERLIWVDINPSEQIVRDSIDFLNGAERAGGVSSCVPSALLKTLEEDELDVEERVQRCQLDARQYLAVKPDIAWSRAQQSIALLGRPGSPAAITDESVRAAAHLTVTEVCFILGLRNARLGAELGRLDLFREAAWAARQANRSGLAAIVEAVGRVHRALGEERMQALSELAQVVPRFKRDLEPWLSLELAWRSQTWIDELEGAMFNARNTAILIEILPPFYDALDLPDKVTRTQRVRQRGIQMLIKERLFSPALETLKNLPERQPKLEAVCYEGLGDFRSAAECHMATGNLKDALVCYRSIPDLEASLKLVDQIGDHPAAESLRWIAEMQGLVERRPDKFTKTVLPAEKKLLEQILERSLGVSRPKPVKRAAVKKTTVKKAAAPKKRVARPKKVARDSPYF
jgi:hypothetical protein